MTTETTEYVIIVGGPATGKTINRSALMEQFNCSECYDHPGAEGPLKASKAKRILILTPDSKVKDPHRRTNLMKGPRITVKQAAAILGSKWISPKEPTRP